MSYRSSGMCGMDIDGDEMMFRTACFCNPKIEGNGFYTLKKMSENCRLLLEDIQAKAGKYKYDLTIIEMPCFTQSAKSAIVIGMLWGIASQIDCICVEPSALKKWSNSKSGDKKVEVKKKVLERVHLSAKEASDDNIIDAIGLAFMFNDIVRQEKYIRNATNPR